MKHHLSILFLSFSISVASIAQTDTLTILHVNDTHSCLSPLAPRKSDLSGTRGGIARAATIIGMTKMTEKNVLTLHAGDIFIGDPFFNLYFGVPELQIMCSLGFDAIALGNHEFDLTPSTLQSALENAFVEQSIPILSSNAIMEDESVKDLKNYVKPYLLKQVGNIIVGIFSLTTPETNIFSLPAPVVINENVFEDAAKMVQILTESGCNIIVCLSHLGVYYDKQIAENLPGIHAIISGHDHLLTSEPIVINDPLGNEVFIVQSDAFYTHVGKLKLQINMNTRKVSLIDYTSIPLDESIPEEPAVKQTIDELTLNLEQTFGIPIFSQQIGLATEDFEEVSLINGKGSWDTPVGNLVTDAFRASTGTDIAITTGGSTAQKLFKGPIVPADVFRMIGYGFNMVNGLGYRIATFKMTGEELWKGLEVCVSQAELNDELLAQVSGMKYDFDLRNPAGSRVKYVEVDGKFIDPSATYTVTANEFLINALPMFGIEITNLNLIEDVTEFQVVSDFIISKQVISPERRGTVTDVNKTKYQVPTDYKLDQNYPNPFNPSTTINYFLPKTSKVTLKIYNVLGKEVTTLVNEIQSAGSYKIEWNAKGLSSGVYFYRLEADSFTQIKKMILTK